MLYAYYTSEPKDLNISEKELHFSINKAFELYNYLLLLILDVSGYSETRIEIARNKRIPTFSDINPNVRFIENKLIAQIRDNLQLNKYVNTHHISWLNYPELIKELYNKLIDSEVYQKYMANEVSHYQEDKKIISNFYTEVLLPINFHQERLLKTDVADVLILVSCRKLFQVFQVIKSIIHVWIDSKIANPEGSEVLEEMGSLAGIDTVIFKTGFHNDPGGRYLRPFDRYAQPWIL